jgi:hypothetical protein
MGINNMGGGVSSAGEVLPRSIFQDPKAPLTGCTILESDWFGKVSMALSVTFQLICRRRTRSAPRFFRKYLALAQPDNLTILRYSEFCNDATIDFSL